MQDLLEPRPPGVAEQIPERRHDHRHVSGAHGSVYRLYHVDAHRPVAIRRIHIGNPADERRWYVVKDAFC